MIVTLFDDFDIIYLFLEKKNMLVIL